MAHHSGVDVVIEQAPIILQPQWAPVPVSTDDIGDLYQDLEYDEDAISLGSVGRWTKYRNHSRNTGNGNIRNGKVC